MRPPPRSTSRRALRALTLLELMVATALGATLLLATAGSAGVFGVQVEHLREETEQSVDEVLADLRAAVHDAWCVEVPDVRQLVVTHPDGAATTWRFRSGVLSVARPDGSHGVLHTELADVRFAAQTRTRYREGTPLARSCEVWSADRPGSLPAEGFVLEPGESLALAFALDSAAPVVAAPVDGVAEQLLDARPTSLELALAAVSPAHGQLTLHLMRARGPGDARPEGAVLGSAVLPLSSLPTASTRPMVGSGGRRDQLKKHGHAYAYGRDGPHGQGHAYGHDNGNNGNGQDHGSDNANHGNGNGNANGNNGGNGNGGTGSSDDGDGENAAWEVAEPPTLAVPVDIVAFDRVVPPGEAYVLVIENTASDAVVLACEPLPAGSRSGVALGDGAGWTTQDVVVARALIAMARVTTTQAYEVVERVRVQFVTMGGAETVATALVAGQRLVEDPWLGVVPGETAP